jgi:DNA-binding beta-propeller fold protein YncE
MAASYTGFVYVSVGNYINKYDGQNGQLLASIQANGEEEYGDLATTIDGNLVAVWYEGRWGIITSLEGHREDLVMFDPDLNIMTSKQAFISALTGDLQSEVHLTVDGNGTIYAESNSTIFVFDKNGNFIDRFTPSEGTLGSFSWVNDIAVDGQGRIYVVESYTIHVFDSNFSFIDDIPLEINVFAIAIDAQNYIWALSSDQVQELQLRQ